MEFPEFSHETKAAISVALSAGLQAQKMSRRPLKEVHKFDESYGHAAVTTHADHLVQKHILEELNGMFPRARFLAEEKTHSGMIQNVRKKVITNKTLPLVKKGLVFGVDPIDGTTMFNRRLWEWSISIGVSKDGCHQGGVIFCPAINSWAIFMSKIKTIAVSKTPYRICLAGATDLIPYVKKFGGEALSATINKYVTITARRRSDKKIVFHYALGTEDVKHPDDLSHPYVRLVLEHVGIKNGIDIASFTDIPFSSGLGSSGAFTVGLLNSLWALQGVKKTPRDLAEEAAHIEISKLGAPIGKHDQYLAAYGGICTLHFFKDGSVKVIKNNLAPKDLKNFEDRLALIYSGTTRSASQVLSPVSASLASFDPQILQGMHEFRKVGGEMRKFLKEKNFSGFGTTLNNLWDVEKKVFANSTDRLDELIALGKKNGALSGIVVGAGRGGFLYFVCPNLVDKQKVVRALAKANAPEYPFFFVQEGSKIIFSE